MAHHRSRRHRADDPPPPAYDPYDAYNGYDFDPYAAYAPPRSRSSAAPAPRSPPRRHKSERRRDPSPGYYSDAPLPAPGSQSRRQRHSRHHDRAAPVEARGRSAGPDPRRRYPSPGPSPGPDMGDKPHRSRASRSKRDRPRQIEPEAYDPYAQDPYSRDPYARDPYARDPYSRSRHGPEPTRDSHRRHSQPSDGHRQRGRASRHADSDEDNYYTGATSRGRRPPSRDRGNRRRSVDARSPSRGRRGTTTRDRERGHGDRDRRQSMPATTKLKAKAAKIPWWQNPMVQAGARTAFTAGAQAAMKSSTDKSPWIGPKGAKVATAALGAALVDGFMGQKYPGTTRQKLAREGVDLAAGRAANEASSHRRHRH